MIGLLILLGSFVVIFIFQRELLANITEGGSDARCKASIEAAARSKSFPTIGGSGRPLIKLDCPRKELVIKKSEIVDGDMINQEKAHKIIADAMLSCWKKGGAGKVDPFSNWDNPKVSYCLICDTIGFDDDLIDFIKNAKDDSERLEKRSIKDLTSFLMTKSPRSGEKSYYEILYKSTPYKNYLEELAKLQSEKGDSIIVPSSAIILQMHKLEAKSSGVTSFVYIVGGAALAVGVVITGGILLAPTVAVTSLGFFGAGALLVVGAPLIPVNGYLLVSNFRDSFKECKGCNAIGGIAFVPAETSFGHEIAIKDDKGNELYKARLCDVMVN